MIKLIAYLLISLTLVTSQLLVSALRFEPASNLHAEFLEINKALDEALPRDRRPEISLYYLELMLEESKQKGDRETLQRALELIVSLLRTVGQCDLDSAIILVANFQANVGSERYERADRTRDIFEHYRTRYATECREYFYKEFSRLKLGISYEDLDLLEAAFEPYIQLDPANPLMNERESAGYWRGSLKMQSISFASQKGAVDLVVEQIGKKVRKLPEMQMRYDRGMRKYVIPKLTKKVLRDYLIVPCENFRKQLAPVLDPARLDMLLVNDSDPEEVQAMAELMLSDEFYYRFIIYNRYCDTAERQSLRCFRQKLGKLLANEGTLALIDV